MRAFAVSVDQVGADVLHGAREQKDPIVPVSVDQVGADVLHQVPGL